MNLLDIESYFNQLYHPFINMDDAFKAIAIKNYMSDFFQLEQIFMVINRFMGKFFSKLELNNFFDRAQVLPKFFPSFNFREFNLDINIFIDECFGYSKIFSFNEKTCFLCNHKLVVLSDNFATCYFMSRPPSQCIIRTKKCLNCEAIHFPNYVESKIEKKRKIYPNLFNSEFISFSKSTVIERLILDSYSSHVLYNHTSFIGFCNAFNYLWKKKQQKDFTRHFLQEKRFTEIWLYYRYCKVVYDFRLNNLNNIAFPEISLLDDALMNIRPTLFELFKNKWAVKSHSSNCKMFDCRNVFVIDGNFKVNRLKCYFNQVYYPFLSGKNIQIGCNKTPKRGNFIKISKKLNFYYFCFIKLKILSFEKIQTFKNSNI
jgi:hypothetical protein